MLWPVRGSVQAVALGVNSHGSAVGYSLQDNKLVATLWNGGQDKGQVLAEGLAAVAINDSGTIAGFGSGHALVWQKGSASRLKGERSIAEALSPGGRIGGAVAGAPVIWPSPEAEPVTLAVPEGMYGQVMAVNDRGQAVGIVHNKQDAWPAYWENGTLRSLKSLILPGSNFTELFPRSVNNRGQLVGVGITKSGEVRGFVYTP